MDDEEVHRLKALECLAGAASELAAGRFNNAANRAYYACFHAAIVALLRAGLRRSFWTHEEVPSLFVGILIVRRKLYSLGVRSTLYELRELRAAADYGMVLTSSTRCRRAVTAASRFHDEVFK